MAMAKRSKKRPKKPAKTAQAALRRLRADVGPQFTEEISRKFGRHVRPDEMEEILDEGLVVVWDRRDELAGREQSEWQEFYLSACLQVARQWSAAGWVRERRQEFCAGQGFLEQFDSARLQDWKASPAGAAGSLSPAQKKLLHEAIAKLPEHLRVIAEADLVDPTGTAPAAPLAKKLGISPNTVYSRRKRYLERLRPMLNDAGFGDL